MLDHLLDFLKTKVNKSQTETYFSPWIHELKRQRPLHTLTKNMSTDVAIVGAGIAGVTTAYFALKNTRHQVLLIESDRVAHGATGHNAGQMVSYFERQVADLVKEFGLEKAAQAQNDVDSAWKILEELFKDTQLKTPFSQFTGYAGCQDLKEILLHLENNVLCKQAQISCEPMLIAEESPLLKQIPDRYQHHYSTIPHQEILKLLETKDTRYVAAVLARKGCMNSALFCEDLIQHLLDAYPDRFTLVEKSPMQKVVLHRDHAVLEIDDKQVTAKKVVLCTNGFERFTIDNQAGADIDAKFHHLVTGAVGYMAGYLDSHLRPPIAISYLPKKSHTGNSTFDDDPYFYLTRRYYEFEPNKKHTLICVGGPEALMDDTNDYLKDHPYPAEAQKVIDDFLHQTFAHAPSGEIKYTFKWHGLMGYTPNGVRCIGPEPLNPVLLYNLGCNGVGILPSIYGGEKISQFLNGENLAPSIFDPQKSNV